MRPQAESDECLPASRVGASLGVSYCYKVSIDGVLLKVLSLHFRDKFIYLNSEFQEQCESI